MRRVGIVALNTFREAVRDRVLYNLVFFALAMIAASILVGQISIGIEEMVIVSLGLSAISVIWEFLSGKFGGLVLTLTVNTIAMAEGLFLALSIIKQSDEHLEGSVLVAVYFILLKLALVVALALLFSCYTTPLLAILCTAGLYIAGLFVKEMRAFQSETMSRALQSLLRGLSYVLPNFENFDVMAAAAHGRAIPRALIAQNTVYAALYCAVVLAAAAAIFTRRNLK